MQADRPAVLGLEEHTHLWPSKSVAQQNLTGTNMRVVLVSLQIRALRSCENEAIDL